MINKADLYAWKLTLQSEIDRLSELAGDRIIQRTPKNPRKFRDFLSGENQLFGSVLEKRIKTFIATRTWEELSGDQMFYLTLRLKLAGLMLDSMIRDEAPMLALVPKAPATSSSSEFWRWLLITVWEALGENYLASWVQDCLEKVAEQRQRE